MQSGQEKSMRLYYIFQNHCGVLSLKTLFKFQEDNSESKMTIHEPVPNFKGKGGIIYFYPIIYQEGAEELG